MTVPAARHIAELVALAGEQRTDALTERAWRLPPADVADLLDALPASSREQLILSWPPELAARGVAHLPPDRAALLLQRVGPAAAARIIDHLADDAATPIVRMLPATHRSGVLDGLTERSVLDRLLAFDSDAAGGVMTATVLVAAEADTVAFALEAVRRQAPMAGESDTLLVVDLARRLVGRVPLAALLAAPPPRQLREVMDDQVISITAASPAAEAARLIVRHGLAALPVVDTAGRLVGRITAAAAFRIIDRSAGEELLRFGGVSPRELWPAGWQTVSKRRLPRLYANLVAGFLAAAVVYFFKGTVARNIDVAVWMPIVAGLGGSAATQAFAVATHRRLERVSPALRRRAIVAEAAIGAVNGIAIGVVVAAVAVLLGESWRFGMVVFLALAVNCVVAGVAGAAAPDALERLGVDPAIASSTFLATVIDVTGLALLLGLAAAMLRTRGG